MTYALLFILGLFTGTLAGIVGTGASLIMLPILVVLYGPKAAVPIMAISSVLANLGRICAWFRQVEWRTFFLYSLGSVPAAALGARTLVAIPAYVADLVLGIFFVAVLVLRRRVGGEARLEMKTGTLLASGAGVGYLTGLVQSTGPLSLAVFTAFGLRLGPLLGTESAASLVIYFTKTVTFGAMGVVTVPTLMQGVFIGSAMIAGAFFAKGIVTRMGMRRFDMALTVTIAVNAAIMLAAAIREYGNA